MAPKIAGITVEIGADTKKLNSALRQANAPVGKLKGELKQVEKALKLSPGNTDLIKQKYEILSNSVKETEGKLKELKAALKQAEASGADKTSAGYRRLQREIVNTEADLKRLTAESNKAKVMSSNFGIAAASAGRLGKNLTAAGQKLRGLTTSMTLVGTMGAIVGKQFDESMSKVQAVSGATANEFDQLREKAREMGAKTKFSASEAAEAMNYMAMAGWKTGDMLNGIEGIMNLAAASGEDLATTSDIVTDGLTAMGYAAKDSGHLADVMAAAASNANTNVGMMGETFKYAAAVAGSMHYSMEDVALATGLMANSGIKASQAGTSLRSMISRMASPTSAVAGQLEKLGVEIENADGTARPFRDVMVDLRKGFKGLSDTEKTQAASTIAGKNAMSGFLAVVNASDKDFNKLTKAIDNSSGSAKTMSETMLDNFGGQLTILKSSLEELAISVSDTVTPMLKTLTSGVQSAVTWYNSLDESTKSLVVKTAMLTAAAGPVLTVFGKLTSGASNLAIKLGTMFLNVGGGASKFGALGKAFAALPPQFKLGAAAVGLFGGAVALAIAQTNKITKENDKYIESAEANIKASTNSATEAQFYAQQLNNLASVESKSTAQKKAMAMYVAKLNDLVPGLNLKYNEETDTLNKSTSAIRKNIQALKDKALAEAYATEAQNIANKMAKQQMEIQEKQAKIEANKLRMQQLSPSENPEMGGGEYEKLAAENAQLTNEINQLTGAIDKNQKKFDEWNQTAVNIQGFSTLSAQAKKAGVSIPKGISDGIKQGKYALPTSVNELKALIKFDSLAAKAKAAGIVIPKELADGVKSGKIAPSEALKLIKKEMEDTASNTSGMKRAGKKAGKAYGDGVSSTKGTSKSAGGALKKAVTQAAENVRNMKKQGASSGSAYGSGVGNAKGKVGSAAKGLAGAAKSNSKVDLTGTGRSAGEGLASGLSGSSDLISKACKKLSGLIPKKIRKLLDINSPSKVMIPIGSGVPEGLAVGIIRGRKFVAAAMQKTADDITGTTFTDPLVAAGGKNPAAVFGGSTSKQTVYNLGDVTLNASDVDGVRSIEDFFEVLKRAKSFA